MNAGLLAVWVILGYLALLIGIGMLSSRFGRGTSADYFVASRGIGPVFLLLTIFGTTMTAFAMVGSTAEAFTGGVGVYGLMVSWSGLVHSLCFFLVGVRLWAFGKRYGYVTQIQFFRDRFESNGLGLVLFPALVGLVIPYLLVGVIGGGKSIEAITAGALPAVFAATKGGIPFWLGSGVVCIVVLIYVFLGGARGATWANAFQTLVFVVLGVVTFGVIEDKLGGFQKATAMVAEHNPAHLKFGASAEDHAVFEAQMAAFQAGETPIKPREPESIPPLIFLTYFFIPFSVAMFPHLFQHWLTARSAKSFKLSVVAHPLLMAVVWFPCVLIGVWATSAVFEGKAVIPPDFANANAVLAVMVRKLAPPVLGGLLTAGVLAAIMSSLDSQFLCVSSIFSNDILAHYVGHDRVTDRQKVFAGRVFVILIVAITYGLGLWLSESRSVFTLGVWCFTGFAGLSPLVFAALYWKGATKLGAYACVLTTVGLGLWMCWQSDFGAKADYTVFGMMPVAPLIIASTAALVFVSLVTPIVSPKTLERFFGKQHAG
ncbi:MAG: sodium:solute symporter family protein [Phycisphaerales bacterium]|nr:sodium:solute symporter family protein [Phycisphaerales bacterium]